MLRTLRSIPLAPSVIGDRPSHSIYGLFAAVVKIQIQAEDSSAEQNA
jgi:hypothetical protein